MTYFNATREWFPVTPINLRQSGPETFPANTSPLEAQLQRYLDLPRRPRRSQDSELSRPKHAAVVRLLRARLCQQEIGVVRDVEEFRAELKIGSLFDREVLEHRHIPDLIPRPRQRVPANVPVRSQRRISERTGVKESTRLAVGPVGVADLVRPLRDSACAAIGIGKITVSVEHGEVIA